MFVECCCFSKFRYRATLGATAALALIATGVILYSAFDLQFSRLGTLFIVTNTVLVVAETLYKRRLLIDDADPLHLSKQAMMLMNALVGLPIVGVAAAILQRGLSGEEMTLVELWPTFDTGEVLYIVGSGVLMTLFNLSGLRLTALISATSVGGTVFILVAGSLATRFKKVKMEGQPAGPTLFTALRATCQRRSRTWL